MPDQNIDDLFERTLSGDYDDDLPWEAVHVLRGISTREVFDKAAEWCRSDDAVKRARGADVLAQLGRTSETPSTRFAEDAYAVLTELLQRETCIQPLDSAITALRFIENPSVVPLMASFGSHTSADTRFSVAFALGQFPDDPLSVQILLQLMADVDDDVRDWATFGLALGNSDSPEIREAFLRCMADSDEDVSEEAIVGLARRKDERILPRLLSELAQPSVGPRIVEAATWMLDMDGEPEDWTSSDYVNALRRRFRLYTQTP